MDSIAKTSLLTAAMRAVETNRTESEGRLFSDPYAELLAGDEGKELLERAVQAAGDQPAIAIRTSYVDAQIREALNQGVRQIVMLAAGMDTRCFRMEFPQGTTLFELDRPEVLAYKKEKLKGVSSHCERHEISVDLREDWVSTLQQAGFKTGVRTFWLVEGLLMYLEESQVLEILEKINSLALSKDILVCDILSRTLLEVPHMKNQLDFLSSIGAPWRFGENDPEALFKKYGWLATTTQAGEVAPTRWPFPVAPRHVPHVPRGFFLRAEKI